MYLLSLLSAGLTSYIKDIVFFLPVANYPLFVAPPPGALRYGKRVNNCCNTHSIKEQWRIQMGKTEG